MATPYEQRVEKLLKSIDAHLEHQNTLIESFAHAFFSSQQQQEDVLAKLLGEGSDPVEESLGAAERMRSGILRYAEEHDPQVLQDDAKERTP